MSVIFITHDLGVIAELCHEVVVMYAGKVAETGPIREIFHNPRHPYTRGLLSSIPTLDSPHKQPLRIIEGIVPSLDDLPAGCRFENRCPHARAICSDGAAAAGGRRAGAFCQLLFCGRTRSLGERFRAGETGVNNQGPGAPDANVEKGDMTNPLLAVEDLKMYFPVYGGVMRRKIAQVFAVDGVSFTIRAGETLGLVGESGCGKTTVGRTLLRLYKPTGGRVHFDGRNIMTLDRSALQDLRRDMQIIFQDPFESLNARHTIEEILEEPFRIHRIGSRPNVASGSDGCWSAWGCPAMP